MIEDRSFIQQTENSRITTVGNDYEQDEDRESLQERLQKFNNTVDYEDDSDSDNNQDYYNYLTQT